jgi:hypothetical protein
MDEFLAKLTNLSYEFLGVIVPGIIAALFLGMWWAALGPIASLWSFEFVPQLTSNNASGIFESLSLKTGIGVAVPGLAIAYFLGHILLWIARSGEPDECATESTWRRVRTSLVFRIPKPPRSFDEDLQPLYDAVQAKFAVGGSALPWTQFYPVVKSYLSKNLTYSLVATYQNKYTLHRSITAAAAGLFWLSAAGAAGGGVTWYLTGVAPRWGLLATLASLAFVLVLCFSSSYMYHWKMFGNTIITEAYSIIYGPDAQLKQ